MAEAPAAAPAGASAAVKLLFQDEDQDIVYTPAIPGATVHLDDKAHLDMWVRRQQMNWLNDGEGKAELKYLNDRVAGRVMLAHERELKSAATRTQREVILYFIFVSLFAVVLSSFTLGESFALSQKIKEQVLGLDQEDFDDVATRDDVWDFLAENINPTIFPEDTDEVEHKTRKNTMIGALRLQQTRVNANEGCLVPEVYRAIITNCYPDGTPSRNSFGRDRQFEAEEVGQDPFFEWAYVYDIPSNVNLSTANGMLQELRDQEWMDLETRRLRVFVTWYNPAVDMFCSMNLDFGFLASGGINPESAFRVLNPQRHILALVPDTTIYFPPTVAQSGLLGAEAIFLLLVVYNMVVEARWLCKKGCYAWIASVWHFLDLVNCFVLLVVYMLRLALLNIVMYFEFAPRPEEFADFYSMGVIVHQVQNWLSVAALITFSKFVKYLQINQQVSALTRTFMHTRHLLLGQMVAVFIIITGFVFALHHAFGRHIFVYSTLGKTFDNLFAVVLGEFDYDEMLQVNPYAGIFIFYLFMLLFFFILYNLIIAILVTAYSEIRRSDEERRYRDKTILATRSELVRIKQNLVDFAKRKVRESRFVQRYESKVAVRKRMQARRSQAKLSGKLQRERQRQEGSSHSLLGIFKSPCSSAKSSSQSLGGGGGGGGEVSEGLLSPGVEDVPHSHHSHHHSVSGAASAERAAERAGGYHGETHVQTASLPSTSSSGPMGARRGVDIRVRFRPDARGANSKVDEARLIDHRAEPDASTPAAFKAVANGLKEKMAFKLHALRRVLALPAAASAEHVAMGVLDEVGLPCYKVLTRAGVAHALDTADMMCANGERRAEIDRDVRAIDLASDGELADWHRLMSQMDLGLLKSGGDVASGGFAMHTRLGSIASAMSYLKGSGRLVRRAPPADGGADGDVDVDATQGTDADDVIARACGKQPMSAAEEKAACGTTASRARIGPAGGAAAAGMAMAGGAMRRSVPPPTIVLQPRPRQPRYRRAADNKTSTERIGGNAPPTQMRPTVRSVHLPGIGLTTRVRRRPVSQEDFENRDDARPVPHQSQAYLGNTGGRVFNVFAQAVGASRSQQHDRQLDVERTARRVRREPRSVIPPRTRAAAGEPGAAVVARGLLAGRGANAGLVAPRGQLEGAGATLAAGESDTGTGSSSSPAGSRGQATPPAAAAPAAAGPGVAARRPRPVSAGRATVEVDAVSVGLAPAARSPPQAASSSSGSPPGAGDAAQEEEEKPNLFTAARSGFMALFAFDKAGEQQQQQQQQAAAATAAAAAPPAAAPPAAPAAAAATAAATAASADDAAEAPDSPAAVQRPTGPRGSESLDVPPPPAVASPVRSTPSPEEMAAAAAAARPVQSSWLADMEQGVEEEASSDRQASADQLGAGEGGEGGVAAGVGLGGPTDDDDDDDFTVERAPTRR